jgi:hypothetical protein
VGGWLYKKVIKTIYKEDVKEGKDKTVKPLAGPL